MKSTQCHVRFNLNQSLALNGSTTKIIKSDKTPTRTVQTIGDEPVKVRTGQASQMARYKGPMKAAIPATTPGNMF